MAVETYELDKKMLEYSISQFRNIPEYVKIAEAFALGCGTIQTAVDYLSNMIDVDKAEGIWLDYIAWLVGTTRETFDITQYFCVNSSHLNVEKLFYFAGISSMKQDNLQDAFLRSKIKAKVAYNNSRATRNENIQIIKGMFNADLVIITKVDTMLLDITIYGDNIFYPAATMVRQSIIKILGNGVGIRNLVVKPKEIFFLDVINDDEAELPNNEIIYDVIKEL